MIINESIYREYDLDLEYTHSGQLEEGSSSEFLQPCQWVSQLDAFWNPAEKVVNQQKTNWMQEILNTPLAYFIHLLPAIDELSCEGAAISCEVSYIGESVAYLLRGLGFAAMGVVALAAVVVHVALSIIVGSCLAVAESYCYSKEPTIAEVEFLIRQQEWDEAEDKIRLLPNEKDRITMTRFMKTWMMMHPF